MSYVGMVLAMLVIFYFLLLRPESKKKKALEKMRSELAVGGMTTKLRAAKQVAAAGCDMVITSGEHPEVLYDIVEGKPVGTRFVGKKWAGRPVGAEGGGTG